MTSEYTDSKILNWLQPNLEAKNIKNLKVKLERTSEKSDGYFSDILFVKVQGETAGVQIEKNLALKCSKLRSEVKADSFTKRMFLTEAYFYETLFPEFVQFQLERGICEPFHSYPEYFGKVLEENQEILIFQDLSNSGYGVWQRQLPMTRNHIELVLKEYAKFHAVSLAMQDQNPELFQKLIQPFTSRIEAFKKVGLEFIKNFINSIDDMYNLFKDELEPEILARWQNFGSYIGDEFMKNLSEPDSVGVLRHGDCWNNNFMFQTTNNPEKVAIIDWQIGSIGSPIIDISFYILVCIAEKDLKDVDDILNVYYTQLSIWLKNLQSDSEKIYPRKQFLKDWQKFSKIGVMSVTAMMKICTLDKNTAPDVNNAIETGNFSEAFNFEMSNVEILKNRMRPLIKYVIEKNLI